VPLMRNKDYRAAAARFLAALSKIDGDCVIKLDVNSVAEALRAALGSPPLPEPVETSLLKVPAEVARAIELLAAHERSDPFVARRLVARWRQGSWSPTAGRREKRS